MKVHVLKIEKAVLELYNPTIIDTFESDEEYEQFLQEKGEDYYEAYESAVSTVDVVNEDENGRWIGYYTGEEIEYNTYN